MTSAIGRRNRRRRTAEAPAPAPSRRGRGFTLIEIVLVLGLIAVAGTIVVANAVALIDRGDRRDPLEQLTAAVREARLIAGRERTEARMWFDAESGALKVAGERRTPAGSNEDVPAPGDWLGDNRESGPPATSDASFSLGERFAGTGARGAVRFFLIPPAEGLRRAPGPEDAEEEIGAVRFAPDRSASRFVAEIDTGSGTPKRVAFDPFSSLPLRNENE